MKSQIQNARNKEARAEEALIQKNLEIASKNYQVSDEDHKERYYLELQARKAVNELIANIRHKVMMQF